MIPLAAIPSSILCPDKAYWSMIDLMPASELDSVFVVKARDSSLVPLLYRLVRTNLNFDSCDR